MVWSAICKIIPWAKVNSICHMSIFIHIASENVCAMPKSIYNMGNCICHMLTFIYVMCRFMCDMRYLICCMFSFICNVSWSIYDISILLCNMSETIYVVSKNPFVCFNSFIIWAKIALSGPIFVAFSLLCCIGKIIHLCPRLYVALAKLYVALADSPFDLYYWVIFRHDFSLGSNFHKVPFELNIHGTDFRKYLL